MGVFDQINLGQGLFDRLTGVGTQGLSLLTALDALLQQSRAQADPTLPALLNTQLQRFADLSSGGGFDLNSAVGGDFGQPSSPITFGAGSGSPFDLPVQSAAPLRETTGLETALGGPGGLLDDIGAFLADPFGRPRGEPISDLLGAPPQQPAPAQAQATAQPQAPPPPPPDLRPPSLVGSFQTGTNFVPQTGLAQVHQGEAIIPADQNPAAVGGVAPQPERQILPNFRDPVRSPVGPSTGPPSTGATFIDTGLPVNQQPAPLAPPAPLNPLQQSISTLQGLTTSGGPITPEIQQILQTQAREQQDALLQNTLTQTREDFGSRGLGLSGVEANAELQGRLGGIANILGANQNIALNAAGQNFGSTLGAAGQLGQTALGAGGLGLANAQFQQQAQNDLLTQIQQLLNQSFATPEQFASSRPSQVALV